MKEIWKKVNGYENTYEISNLGRIKSIERIFKDTIGRKVHVHEKILKQRKDRYGYMRINTHDRHSLLINRLVAIAFIPNPNNYPVINHKDENKLNNKVDNLEWCTQKYNVNYGTRTKRQAKTASKKVYQYSLDKRLIKCWNSTQECKRNGFDQSHVGECCRGERKYHKGYIWSYTPLDE